MKCENCEWMKTPHEGLYCYMFKNKPDVVDEWGGYCAQHSDAPKLPPRLAKILIALLCWEGAL